MLILLFIGSTPNFAKEAKFINDGNKEAQLGLQVDVEKKVQPTRLKLFLEESDYLTGDWFGARSYLEEHGVDIQGRFAISPFASVQKGKGRASYQNLFDLSTEFDTEKMDLYKGGKFTIGYLAANKGIGPSEYLGTFSEINCYEPQERMSQIGELYYEHSFKDDVFNIKIGRQNAEEDFQNTENSELFSNHSFHVIPNIPMPEFLAPQMGVRAKLRITENVYFQTGIYDGDIKEAASLKGFFTGRNGYISMVETHYLANFKDHEGKYALGGWLGSTGSRGGFEVFEHEKHYGHDYEHEQDSEDNAKKRNYNFGGYFAFEQKLLHAFDDNSGGLTLLGKFGYAPDSINEIPYYCSLCLVWKGITEKRKDDKVGLALAWHQYNNALRAVENRTNEKVVELFYKFKVTNFLSFKPGMQYIMHPGGSGDGSFAFGLRTELVF